MIKSFESFWGGKKYYNPFIRQRTDNVRIDPPSRMSYVTEEKIVFYEKDIVRKLTEYEKDDMQYFFGDMFSWTNVDKNDRILLSEGEELDDGDVCRWYITLDNLTRLIDDAELYRSDPEAYQKKAKFYSDVKNYNL